MLKRIRELLSRRSESRATEPSQPERRTPVPPVHRGPEVVHLPIPESDLDADAVRIVRRLTRFDHTAYLVGGCVRDLLLGRKPKDFDVATSATPRQVKRLFSNCRIIGRRFRLAHIYFQSGKIIEVATFRARDGEDADGQGDADILIREDNVFGTPEEDALRRDFTINALFYDLNAGTVIDHAGGLGDLRRTWVRTIGEPAIRFREDPIRILRAIKFAARLGFVIESSTLDAVHSTRDEIPKAAPPRIQEELNRFCRGGAGKRSFELLLETGAFEVVLPELGSFYARDARARELLWTLLAAIDRRTAAGQEPSGGEMYACLLLPRLTADFGWTPEGVTPPPRSFDLRETVENHLRPVAFRLKTPRRDQERCQQILGVLLRMIPAKRLRRSQRLSILRRPVLGDALWILEALVPVYGAEFQESLELWRQGEASARETAARQPEVQHRGRPAADEPPHPKRRRRRRRGGGAKPKRPEVPRGSPVSQQGGIAPAPRWDDDYFFAALPQAPPLDAGEDGTQDRYGARDLDRERGASAGEHGGAAEAPPRRRRPRRRRKRPGGSPPPSP